MSKNCRFCNKPLNKVFVDLGKSPLANSFLKSNEFDNEKFYPLCVYACENCLLVQLEEIESPKNIFSEYVYFSSYSYSWLQHAKEYVEMIVSRFPITRNNLIIEIASNDGYLLQFFKEKDINVLGIEPASNVAQVAIEKNIETLIDFFNTQLATKLTECSKHADLIICNNVLAHVPNLNDFINGLKILLNSNGIITIEVPHLLQLIKYNQFDTIYHEHFSYFSLYTLKKIFSFHGLVIFDVDELSTHGGSIRLYITHNNNQNFIENKKVDLLIHKEKEFGLDNIKTYTDFSKNILKIKSELLNFLHDAKKSGKKVVGYGAPAKGNTLLNYCGIDRTLLDFTVDLNPHKQDLFLPGTHIPILSTDYIATAKPDYVLILPWNLKEEIMTQLSYIKNWQGKFVIPIPSLTIY